ncbi:MAG: efflux RND transporter periplasmic adaptor subunit [Blastocatellia bacterium]
MSEQESPVTVAVAKAGREDLSQQLALGAEFRPYREIDLHAKVAGYVKEIGVEVGDSVRQGQLIATLEIPEFNNDLNQVRVQEASEARAKTMADYTVIIAPFSGLITKRHADKGAMIQAGTASQTQAMPVVRLSQVDRLRLILPIPESVVPGIRIGRAVKIKVPALGQTYDGHVARFSGKVDSATRTMETEVDVANPRMVLKPGMYAYADLSLELKTDTLTVPVQAISRKDNKASVMIVNARNKIEQREVTTGIESPASVEIVSGLAENELVVIGNQGQLKPGQAVRFKEMAVSASKGGH